MLWEGEQDLKAEAGRFVDVALDLVTFSAVLKFSGRLDISAAEGTICSAAVVFDRFETCEYVSCADVFISEISAPENEDQLPLYLLEFQIKCIWSVLFGIDQNL